MWLWLIFVGLFATTYGINSTQEYSPRMVTVEIFTSNSLRFCRWKCLATGPNGAIKTMYVCIILSVHSLPSLLRLFLKILTDNNNFATCSYPGNGECAYLVARDFGFSVSYTAHFTSQLISFRYQTMQSSQEWK
jgi:hypothetical protein